MMLLPDLRVRQRDYLLEIARALSEELDLDKLLSRILRIALEMLTGQAGLIALRQRQTANVIGSDALPDEIVTPAFARANSGKIKNADQGCRLSSRRWKFSGFAPISPISPISLRRACGHGPLL